MNSATADDPSRDPAGISRLIRHRRTVKPAAMDDRPVTRELLEIILENAAWAPTHGLTEPWRFTVYQGDARRELAGFLQELYRRQTPEEHFRADKFEKLGKNPLLAPVVIAIGMKRQDIEKIPEIEEIEAVACAVQNMHLTAAAMGLGAFWSSPPIIYSDEMTAFLGLGEKDRCLGLLYLGHLKDGLPWPESHRQPATEKTRWIQT